MLVDAKGGSFGAKQLEDAFAAVGRAGPVGRGPDRRRGLAPGDRSWWCSWSTPVRRRRRADGLPPVRDADSRSRACRPCRSSWRRCRTASATTVPCRRTGSTSASRCWRRGAFRTSDTVAVQTYRPTVLEQRVRPARPVIRDLGERPAARARQAGGRARRIRRRPLVAVGLGRAAGGRGLDDDDARRGGPVGGGGLRGAGSPAASVWSCCEATRRSCARSSS